MISKQDKNRIDELNSELDIIEQNGFNSEKDDIKYKDNLIEMVGMVDKYSKNLSDSNRKKVSKGIEDIIKIIEKNKE